MSVPTNLIPTKITGLPEYTGRSQAGYFPYVLDGSTYKVQFSNVASAGEVPPSRTLTAGTGLVGGGDLSANRVFAIANGGVGASQLDTTGVVAGVYGNGSNVPTVTVDANGRVTSVTTSPVVAVGYVPEGRTVTAGTGLLGGGSLAGNITLSLNLATATPQALGIATAGVSIAAARGDHVHPAVDLSDTNETQGSLPLGRGGTGDALSPVAGAVVYSTGSKFALTNPGIAGQVLTSGGVDEPVWTTIAGTGTVTSVNASGGTTGMTFTGGPITTAGTLTLGGTLAINSGGTGLTNTPSNGQILIGNGSGYTLAVLTAGTGVSVTNAAGSITIANTAPDRIVSLTAGAAISVSGTYPNFTVANTAPDQIVSLTGAGTTSISGTYPNFTITSNDQFGGTVTSVAASGGATGLTFSGSPITSAGTLTLGGTLAATSGGTGLSAAPANGQLAIGNGTGYSLSTITAGSGVSVTNAAGSITITNTAPDQIVSLTAGTAISVTGTYPSFTVANTAPDQIVSLTGAGTTSISGTYPNFTITSNDQFNGTVTSVAASGGTTGLTFSGSPITSAGTLTLGGTLAIGSGGTGATTAGAARAALSAAALGANTDITSIALTSGTILNAPTSGTDIVNKAYADSIASGINFHQSVRLATVAALPAYTYNNGTGGVGATITANANGALSIDGVAVVAGNRVLIKNEVGAAEANHGVYVVTQAGNGSTPFILTRATDFDTAGSGVDQIDAGDFFLVTAGSTLSNTSWVQQTPLPITVGTTPIIFSQFGAPVLYSAGTGLTLAGTVFSITNTGVSANTYGSASQVPVIAVNAQGQITSASSTSIAIDASQVTSGALAVARGGTALSTTPTNGQLLIGNGTGYSLSTLSAGTGVSVTNGSGSVTVTNTAPDQIVTLTGGGSTSISGTYPNFTITSTAGTGTVTSVAASGGTTGLTFTGSPITTSGTLTLGGTLAVANGGTGATTLSSGFLLRGNGTSPVSASVVFDNGTNVGIGTSSPSQRLDVNGNINASGNGQFTNATYCFVGTTSGTVEGQFAANAGGGVDVRAVSNHPMLLYTNNTERMRIDSAGLVGIGTSAPGTALDVAGDAVRVTRAAAPAAFLGRQGNGTLASPTATTSGNQILVLAGSGHNGSAYTTTPSAAMRYLALEDFTATANGAAITFETTPIGSSTAARAERMRIDGSGNVGIGTSAPISTIGRSLHLFNDANTGTVASNTILVVESANRNAVIDLSGSASATNSVVFSDTVGTGLASIASEVANQNLIFRSGGTTERMRIDASGNLLVGTTSNPDSARLVVSGGSITHASTQLNTRPGTATQYEFVNRNGAGFDFYVNNASNLAARIDSSGNVGIGITNPAARLQVREDLDGTTGVIIQNRNGSGTPVASLRFITGGLDLSDNRWAGITSQGVVAADLRFFTSSGGPIERMRIASDGKVLIGGGTINAALGDMVLSKQSSGTATFALESQGSWNATIAATSSGDMIFSNPAASERMRIVAGGNVGIGTSSPSSRLDVAGTITATGWSGGGVVTETATQTLTNKRIDPRAVPGGTSGTLTINGNTTDLYEAENLVGAITFAQPSGTPVDGQKLMIRIKDNGTARGITWTTSAGAFRAVGITLPTTTVSSRVTYVGCVYNSTDGFWDAIATVTQA